MYWPSAAFTPWRWLWVNLSAESGLVEPDLHGGLTDAEVVSQDSEALHAVAPGALQGRFGDEGAASEVVGRLFCGH